MSGFYGGRLDALIMRVIDVLLAFPGILLALAIVSVLTPGLTNVMIAVGLSAVPDLRAAGAGQRALRAREPLRGGGARARRSRSVASSTRYILPNVVAPLIVTATLGLGTAILSAAALSFLGLGSQPPQPEWGRMLSEGRDYLREAWWISTFPGPRHHAHRARHEPARRRPARRPRSAAQGVAQAHCAGPALGERI